MSSCACPTGTSPCTTCGACERDTSLDSHHNAAGLDSIHYRIGTYALFRDRMRGWLSRQVVPPNEESATARPLAALGTRAEDDPTLALIDAWACSLDVLTFYQERIANEGFIGTAVERRSLIELAGAIGYQLDPGVAASTRLAFTLQDGPKAPAELTLAIGTQADSVPGPGERPQTFETVEAILARPDWNAMLPVQREEHPLRLGEDTIYLMGLSTKLKVGDALLVVGGERLEDPTSNVWDLRTIVDIELDKDAKVTVVTLHEGLGWQSGSSTINPPAIPQVFAVEQRLGVFGQSAPDPRFFGATYQAELVTAGLVVNPGPNCAWVGFNIYDAAYDPEDATALPAIHVVGEHPELIVSSWLLLQDPDYTELYRITESTVTAQTNFSLSLKTTRLGLDAALNIGQFEPRSAAVLAATRSLPLATRPITLAIGGDEIVLDDNLPLLEKGRAVFVIGPRAAGDLHGPEGEEVAELGIIAEAKVDLRHGTMRTVLKLEAPLVATFERTATRIWGNVARATHGKTVAKEVLGSGDGSKQFQTFKLRQSPLTYVSDPAAGITSTLTLRVGGVAWTAVESTYGLTTNDRSFVPRIDDHGITSLLFGDGQNGARPSTGTENIVATYRVGLGAAGSVSAGSITTLKSRPKGLKSVVNPIAAVGGEDPETLADARKNAPVTVLTLDRLVSLSDYEAYARAQSGVGKAQSVRLWDGRRWWVHLTIATTDGAALRVTDDLYQSLLSSIQAHRDPVQRVIIGSFVQRSFKLRGTIRVDPAYVTEDLVAAIDSTLRATFAFAQRQFGQVVSGAEILACCHQIPGLLSMDLDALWRDDQPPPSAGSKVPSSWILASRAAGWEGGASGGVKEAELLLIDKASDAIDLTLDTRGNRL